MGKMVHRFNINQHEFSNSLGTSGYHHNLISFPNMECDMSVETSRCPLKKLEKKKSKKEIKSHLQGQLKPQITNFGHKEF